MRRAWIALVPVVLGGLCGCALPRPEGAYEPPETDAGDEADAAPDSDDDVYADAARSTAGDAGAPDVGKGGTDAGEVPASPLIGDYWMRADLHTKVSASMLGLTVRTTTDTAVYSLVTVRANGTALELRDWQCALRMVQRCNSGCSSVSTTLRDPVTSARAYLAPRRTLEVDDDGAFRIGRGPFAVGWKGDYAADPSAVLPTADDDPLVYNPDGGGEGVDITTSVRVSVGLPVTCNFRAVQRVDVVYEGALTDGKLASGTLRDVGSAQNELANSCGEAEPQVAEAAPSTVRLIPAKVPIDVEALPWKCPTLSELEAAFK